MPQITLTEEQARIVAGATEPVEVCDPVGNPLATIQPTITAADIAEAKRRLASKGPRYSSQQVQAHLQALEQEWERTGGFDRPYMLAFLERLRAQDSP
jgi:hypothetical protein